MYCSLPGLVAVLIFLFFPIVYNVYLSFCEVNVSLKTGFVGLQNYSNLFRSPDFHIAWQTSAIFSLGTTGLTLVTSMMIAHSLNGIKRFNALFRTFAILPWAAPLVISGLMWRWILSKDIGILNYFLQVFGLTSENVGFLINPILAMLSGIVAASWSYIPFVTVLLLTGLESIPVEIYEAGKVDGADALQRFRYISFPLNRPQIVSSALIVWMYSFRTPDIFVALTNGGPGKATYHAGIFLWDNIYRYLNFGRAGAISVLLSITILIPSVLIIYFLNRGSIVK